MTFFRQSGMTLIELLVAICALSLFLVLLHGLFAWHIDQAKIQQANHLIAALDRAIEGYQEKHGVWPVGSPGGRLQPVLAMISKDELFHQVLETIPPHLLYSVDGQFRCRDPWGAEPRYLFRGIENDVLLRQVELNGGMPVLECAGPDRDFGDRNPARQADNIRSDEPLVDK